MRKVQEVLSRSRSPALSQPAFVREVQRQVRHNPSVVPPASLLPGWAWATAVGIALAAAAPVWWPLLQTSPPPEPARSVSTSPEFDVPPLQQAIPQAAQWIQRGRDLDQPLHEELNALVADATGAMQFLTENFRLASVQSP